jgi:hypothetical protein
MSPAQFDAHVPRTLTVDVKEVFRFGENVEHLEQPKNHRVNTLAALRRDAPSLALF